MKSNFRERAPFQRSFIAGTYSLARLTLHRLRRLNGGIAFICRQGRAVVEIDLKRYTITPDTGGVFLPGTIFRIDSISPDFTLSLCYFSHELLHEASFRIGLGLFGFLKEHPCDVIPNSHPEAETMSGIIHSLAAIYADHRNLNRDQIAKLLLRSLLLDLYDKTHRFFDRFRIQEGNRQEELFRRFTTLLHEFAGAEREVSFYADRLCISTKYLTSICRRIVGASAKAIIDHFTLMEIKVLLQSTELSIQELSDRLRFPDQSYLGRYFKRHEGVSPKEFRAGCRSI
ncbi:MAG: helix-turn-helix transcriptional regulator [Rikenella sp.]|nr:helix-turn-helix transcriptional regulator [Rikenella sp.]